jgi:hypothetical protein
MYVHQSPDTHRCYVANGHLAFFRASTHCLLAIANSASFLTAYEGLKRQHSIWAPPSSLSDSGRSGQMTVPTHEAVIVMDQIVSVPNSSNFKDHLKLLQKPSDPDASALLKALKEGTLSLDDAEAHVDA